MTTFARFLLATSILAIVHASAAQTEPDAAQDADEETPEFPAAADAEDWLEVELLGGVWIPRLNGSAKLGPAGAIGLKSDLELDEEREIAWNAELTVRVADRWQVRGIAADFSTDGSGIAETFSGFGTLTLAPGDPYEASVDLETYAGEFGLDVIRPYPTTRDRPWPRPEPESTDATSFRFTALAGARYFDVSQSVEVVGVGAQSGSGEWLAVYGGVEMQLDHAPEGGLLIGQAVSLRTTVATGYDVAADGGPMWEVRASLRVFLAPNTSVLVGYRLLDLDVDDGDFTFDAGLRGLLFGGSIAF